MEQIALFFPDITAQQRQQLQRLGELYRDWNDKINVISRKDIDNVYDHHILHALGLLKVVEFKPGAAILDLGTGGGIPGIPLAIMMPEVSFHLVDGRGKKITVVNEIAAELGLENVVGEHVRAEEIKNRRYDFVVARGVTTIDKLLNWTRPLLKRDHRHGLPNGLLTYKGSHIKKELELLPKGEYVEEYPMRKYFKLPFFEEKSIWYVQG